MICLLFQVFDFYPSMKSKFSYQELGYIYDYESFNYVLEDINHIIYLDYSNDEDYSNVFKIAYIAMQNYCTVNKFYFARDIDGVYETSNKYSEKLSKGLIEDNEVYVIKKEDIENINKSKLYYYEVDEFIVITSKEVENLQKNLIEI